MIDVAPGRTTGQALPSSEAAKAARSALSMSVIIEAGMPDPGLRARVDKIVQALDPLTEIRVVCARQWDDAPPGVSIVVNNASSRGDRLDTASEGASGDLLAFINASVEPHPGWQARAVELLYDETIAAAGGPHLLPDNPTPGQRAAWLVLSSKLGSGPLTYRFIRAPRRDVREMPTTNMVVRRSAFEAVGGFQSPSPLGDDARLCYKLRALLGLRVVCDPGLAVADPPPALQRPFLSLLLQWGRKRGDLGRRLPETCRGLAYPLPALGLLLLALLASAAVVWELARIALLSVVVLYALAGLWMMLRGHHLTAGALAAVGLPLSHAAYGAGFWLGYLGPNLGEATPGRFRQRPPRILIMNWRDITHPWAGGAEAYMHEIARRWARDGADVGWLCGRYRGGKRTEVIDGIRIHRVGGHFTLYPLAALAYLLRLRRRYDVVIDCENGIPFFAPLYARKPVVLVVFHVHAEVFRTELPKYLARVALFLEGWVMPRVYRHNQLVTISASTRADLRAAGYAASRIRIVTSGVELPAIERSVDRSSRPLLVYLGRLKRYKSVDVLLRAMPDVRRVYPDARLAIVGQGPDRHRLERIAWNLGLASSVHFYGYLDRQTRDNLLARAWVAVCPSAFEGFGVICLEANALGTPVVASQVAGLKDAVLDGRTGHLVPYGDSAVLADALTDLVGDPAKRLAMGQAGREWAAAHSWDQSAHEFLDLVLATLPAARPAPALAPGLR